MGPREKPKARSRAERCGACAAHSQARLQQSHTAKFGRKPSSFMAAFSVDCFHEDLHVVASAWSGCGGVVARSSRPVPSLFVSLVISRPSPMPSPPLTRLRTSPILRHGGARPGALSRRRREARCGPSRFCAPDVRATHRPLSDGECRRRRASPAWRALSQRCVGRRRRRCAAGARHRAACHDRLDHRADAVRHRRRDARPAAGAQPVVGSGAAPQRLHPIEAAHRCRRPRLLRHRQRRARQPRALCPRRAGPMADALARVRGGHRRPCRRARHRAREHRPVGAAGRGRSRPPHPGRRRAEPPCRRAARALDSRRHVRRCRLSRAEPPRRDARCLPPARASAWASSGSRAPRAAEAPCRCRPAAFVPAKTVEVCRPPGA